MAFIPAIMLTKNLIPGKKREIKTNPAPYFSNIFLASTSDSCDAKLNILSKIPLETCSLCWIFLVSLYTELPKKYITRPPPILPSNETMNAPVKEITPLEARKPENIIKVSLGQGGKIFSMNVEKTKNRYSTKSETPFKISVKS